MTLVMPWTQKKHPFPCLEGCFRSGDAARLFARIYQNEQMCCLIWSSSFIRKKKIKASLPRALAEICRNTQRLPGEVSFLINRQKPSARRAQLFHTHLSISVWISRSWDLSTDYSQCPQQLSKCSPCSRKNKEGISSRCCSFAGALTRDEDALHKQTPLHTTAAPERVDCTSGWVHIWQHLLSPPYCQGGSLKSETAARPRHRKPQSGRGRQQTLPLAGNVPS